MRHLHRLPLAIIETGHGGRRRILAGLGIGALVAAEAEVPLQIGGVTQVEAPVIVEPDGPARCGTRFGMVLGRGFV